ncbi:hypothetical protein SYJ56_10115 [Algoriphagus sp. D3-2-R+10]|uniref:hypothetical protein n=1 Tax=Algoriphagus aurantiacus TaxID=3103948 RepID=UPI002B3C2FDC|nr:hypothetical protein [Algoriphagus sp. D3-2-R+10]MEB2775662.1 hypothetical protein [Algoriphagus sp. D3-2-R+10]
MGELIVNYSSINGESNVAIYQDGEVKLAGFLFDPVLFDSPLDKRNILSKIDEHNYLLALGLRDTLYAVNYR